MGQLKATLVNDADHGPLFLNASYYLLLYLIKELCAKMHAFFKLRDDLQVL
jgi:hypothetical protein